MVTKQRYSNIELYRIIIMILIVAHHYVDSSGLLEVMKQSPTSFKSIYLYIFGMWGKTGINCFVLITGYFMCQSHITLRKFTKLVFWIEFYRIVTYLIFCASGYINFSLAVFARNLMPVYNITHGFVGCFLIFFLTIPFLNILIKNMSKRQHFLLLLLSLFIYSLWAQIPYLEVRMNYVIWFDVLYILSSYIRLHISPHIDHKKWGWLTLLSILISVLSVVVIVYHGRPELAYFFVSDSNALLAVIVSVCAFMWFKSYPIKYHKWINSIGATTFGVLLIHTNSDTMIKWLWKDSLNNVGYYDGNIYLHSVICVLCVFFVCTIIDQLRLRFIEEPLFIVLDRYMANRNNKFIFEWV
ncbi:MAG: acyltransferase family protein [Muribaculaceae bacterium]|nr:acyltransferase family protein [Muribaculaceae bacterium]